MNGKNGEKIKLYLVIALSVIFVISFYFRFIQAKVKETETGHSPEPPPARAEILVPRIDPSLLRNTRARETLTDNGPEEILRDIFIPAFSFLKSSKKPGQPEPALPPQPLPSYRLSGTIVGRESAIAVIDNRFLRPGDSIGEYRVARIGEKDVLLESGERKILLEILK